MVDDSAILPSAKGEPSLDHFALLGQASDANTSQVRMVLVECLQELQEAGLALLGSPQAHVETLL